jgi:hypothetical protein
MRKLKEQFCLKLTAKGGVGQKRCEIWKTMKTKREETFYSTASNRRVEESDKIN